MTHKELIIRINSFSKLKKNWDSYGAKTINKRTIALAKTIVSILNGDKWFVAPVSDGSIEFDLDNKIIEVWAK